MNYSADQIIIILMPNPKKYGSKAYERYQKYRTGMTINDALKAGVTHRDLRWDSERAHIALGWKTP